MPRRLVMGELLVALVLSLVVNLPALAARDAAPRAELLAVGVGAVALVGWLLHRFGRTEHVHLEHMGVMTQATQVTTPVDIAVFQSGMARAQRWSRLWLPLAAAGLVVGSVLGAIAGPWPVQVLGGAAGLAAAQVGLRHLTLGPVHRLLRQVE